jgi:hypothetical protein
MTDEQTDVMRTGIGLLTMIHTSVVQGRQPGYDRASMLSAYALLRQNITDFRLTVPDIEPEEQELMERVADAVAQVYAKRLDWLMFGILKGFGDVVTAYLDDGPDVDIAAILQRAALDLPAPPAAGG